METAARDTLAQLRKAVTCRYHAIAHEFENFDAAKTNTVSKDEFRAVCNHHVQILTDKQVRRRWVQHPEQSGVSRRPAVPQSVQS